MTPPRAKAGPKAAPQEDPDSAGAATAGAGAAENGEDAERELIEQGIAELSYEQARDALVDVVRRLESGGEALEESLALWQRGEALARHCENWLAGARARIEAAQQSTAETS